ncbi:MAG: 30S ribosomal protein S15 [Candidatus Hecatellales archaeon B24]|nr:MAG: 30S ribosomal protein S15 [Candidatus Hecatellales archaeon B24]
MARIHTHRRGSSHSTRPIGRRPPSWCTYKPEEVEALVVKLAKEGRPPSEIGIILRDQYGIPLVKPITGKSVTEILEEAGLALRLPEDLANLLEKQKQMVRHLEKHRADKKNVHSLQLLESRIHRLIKYYRRLNRLPPDFKYKPVSATFM